MYVNNLYQFVDKFNNSTYNKVEVNRIIFTKCKLEFDSDMLYVLTASTGVTTGSIYYGDIDKLVFGNPANTDELFIFEGDM